MDYLASVKLLLGATAPSDTVIQYWVDSTIQYVKTYCNIGAVPAELDNTIVELICTRIQFNQTNKFGANSREVASVTDGSQSVSYTTISGKTYGTDEDILKGYDTQLNKFRRMKW